MKIHAASPARAACAATAFARLPVDAQPTVSSPSAIAALIADATTRSLNESDGCDTASFLIQSARDAEPVGEPRCIDQRRESGVLRQRGRTLERQPLAIAPHRRRARRDLRAIRQPTRRRIHRLERTEAVPQIASGAASNSAPHSLQCCGSASQTMGDERYRHRAASGARARVHVRLSTSDVDGIDVVAPARECRRRGSTPSGIRLPAAAAPPSRCGRPPCSARRCRARCRARRALRRACRAESAARRECARSSHSCGSRTSMRSKSSPRAMRAASCTGVISGTRALRRGVIRGGLRTPQNSS